VYGAGGAARACALALAQGGLGRLTVVARDPARAEGVRTAVEGFETRLSLVGFSDVPDAPPDLIVNATPLGARGESLPLPPLEARMLVVDLLYWPSVTPLQLAAREAGAAAFGGLGLLLHQAALSFERWTGQVPSLDVMSAAALAALTELAEGSGGGPSAEV
jgi:shikimate dehydrogenase